MNQHSEFFIGLNKAGEDFIIGRDVRYDGDVITTLDGVEITLRSFSTPNSKHEYQEFVQIRPDDGRIYTAIYSESVSTLFTLWRTKSAEGHTETHDYDSGIVYNPLDSDDLDLHVLENPDLSAQERIANLLEPVCP